MSDLDADQFLKLAGRFSKVKAEAVKLRAEAKQRDIEATNAEREAAELAADILPVLNGSVEAAKALGLVPTKVVPPAAALPKKAAPATKAKPKAAAKPKAKARAEKIIGSTAELIKRRQRLMKVMSPKTAMSPAEIAGIADVSYSDAANDLIYLVKHGFARRDRDGRLTLG